MALLGRLTIIVPAAGSSRRAGTTNKLLLPLHDRTVVSTVVSRAVASGFRTIAVVGYDAERISEALDGLSAEIVHNPRHEHGMSTSIVSAVDHDSAADFYMIWPADMPMISSETVQLLARSAARGRICVPTLDGRRGHPVLFSGTFRDDLCSLTGDTGARSILEDNPQAVDEIPVTDPGILVDIDGPDVLERIVRGEGSGHETPG